MNKDVFFAINEPELESLSLELIDYADDISSILSKINAKIDTLDLYCDGKAIIELKEKYSNFKVNYSIVKQNINTYSSDLIDLIQKAKTSNKKIVNIIEEGQDDLRVQAKNLTR